MEPLFLVTRWETYKSGTGMQELCCKVPNIIPTMVMFLMSLLLMIKIRSWQVELTLGSFVLICMERIHSTSCAESKWVLTNQQRSHTHDVNSLAMVYIFDSSGSLG
jgi:hypothetical protein